MDISGGKIHDFRSKRYCCGWNLFMWEQKKKKFEPNKTKVKVLGIGKRINKGEFIIVTQGKYETVWKIKNIDYYSDPPDMFTCEIILIEYKLIEEFNNVL